MNSMGMLYRMDIRAKYYILTGLYRFIVTMKFPILTIFLLNEGFSIVQVGMGYTLMSITVLLSDIPLGIIADRTNKKNVFLVGVLIEGISAFLFVFSNEMVLLLIAFVFWGVGISSYSGVLQGWFINESNKKKSTCNQSEVFSKARVVSNVATFLGMVSSAIVASSYSYEIVFYLMFFLLSIYACIAFLIINEIKVQKDLIIHSKDEYIGFIKKPAFIFILAFNAVLGFVYSGYAVIWMPIFMDKMNIYSNGRLVDNTVIYALSYLISGFSVIYLIGLFTRVIPNLLQRVYSLRVLFSLSFLFMGVFSDYPYFLIIFTLLMFIFGDLEYGSLSELNNVFLMTQIEYLDCLFCRVLNVCFLAWVLLLLLLFMTRIQLCLRC